MGSSLPKVMPLWWEFNSWVRENRVLHCRPMDNFLQHSSIVASKVSNRRRKIWWTTATRSIWKLRNDIIFHNQPFHISKLVDNRNFLTWSWLRGREKDFNVPFHQWSSAMAPTALINRLTAIQRQFLWGASFEGKKIASVAWRQVSVSRDLGGLGIKHIKMQDTMVWKADPSGFYSTKSAYSLLMTFNRPVPQRRILQTIEACNAHKKFSIETKWGTMMGSYPFSEEQPIPKLVEHLLKRIEASLRRELYYWHAYYDRRLPPGITALLKLEGRNFLLLEGRCVNNNQRLLIVNVYAPCDLAGKRVLWDELRQLRASNPNGLWCFLGDFNSIRSPEERISLTQRSVDSYDISAFNQWISDMELQEIKCVGSSFTWIRPNGCVKSRLHRFLVSEHFGVVLLELLTGRRPVGNFGEEGLDIVQWTKLQTNWSNDKVVKILDERLCHIPLDEAKQVYFVAMLCVQEQSVERPTMREVVEMLAQAKKPNTFQKQ
ncbi:Leucine-rich repeat receptor-like serine/threonine-protein kinase BAM3 [Glycine max]|nr:Leucine-rich repeat receptor-like serine/threonine-protein kinase BAM3 [Glycine max]